MRRPLPITLFVIVGSEIQFTPPYSPCIGKRDVRFRRDYKILFYHHVNHTYFGVLQVTIYPFY